MVKMVKKKDIAKVAGLGALGAGVGYTVHEAAKATLEGRLADWAKDGVATVSRAPSQLYNALQNVGTQAQGLISKLCEGALGAIARPEVQVLVGGAVLLPLAYKLAKSYRMRKLMPREIVVR